MAIAEWTIGTGGDYATIALHRSAQTGSLDDQVLTILDTQTQTAEVRYFAGNFPSVKFKTQVGREFDGRFDSSITDMIDGSGLADFADVFQTAIPLIFEKIAVIGSPTRRPINVDAGGSVTGVESGIMSHIGEAVWGLSGSVFNLFKCVIVSDDIYASYDATSSTTITLNQCTVVGNSSIYGALRERFSTGNYTASNCLFYNTGGTKGLTNGTGNLSGTNNATQDTSANDVAGSANNLINQPVSTFLENEAGRDYRINSTGVAVLQGAGLGGVDIGAFLQAGAPPSAYPWWLFQEEEQ